MKKILRFALGIVLLAAMFVMLGAVTKGVVYLFNLGWNL